MIKLSIAGLLLLTIVLSGCLPEPPTIRAYNQYMKKVDVEVSQLRRTVFLHDVREGTSSAIKVIGEGDSEAKAYIEGSSSPLVSRFKITNNNLYTVIIVNGTVPRIKISIEGK